MQLTLSYLQQIKPSYISKGFPVPKWIQFAETLLQNGWKVDLQRSKSTVSKYLYISYGGKTFKVRFSNHKANKNQERKQDSDFYVGVGNKGVITTEQLLEKLLTYESA